MGTREPTAKEAAAELELLRAQLADIQQQRERLETALTAGAVRFWDSDLNTGHVSLAPIGVDLFETGTTSSTYSMDDWYSHIHPDDLERVKTSAEDARREGDHYQVEYRIVLPDDSIRWLESRAAVIRDEKGEAVRMIGVSTDISQRTEATQALRESEQRFRELAANVREVFWMHDVLGGMQLLYVSPAYETVWGRKLTDIYAHPQDWIDAIHEDDVDRVSDVFFHAVENEAHYDAEFRMRRPDGQIRWIHDRGHPVRDESGVMYRFAGIAEDITEQKNIAEELRQHREELERLVAQRTEELESSNEDLKTEIKERQEIEASLRLNEERLKSIFEGIADSILVHDENRRILDCNEAMCRRLKYSREELLNMTTDDIDSPEFAADFDRRLKHQLGEGYCRVEGVHVDRDGNLINVDCITTRIEYEGRPAVLAAVRDITQQKEAEEERRQLERQMQHAQKLESLGVLAGGIAHDFNNLLLGVLGSAELAIDNIAVESPAYEDVKSIEQAAKKAADLCRQMLAYAGKGRFVVEAVDLNDVIHDMSSLLETTVSKKSVLRYRLKENIPAVMADSSQLTQILMNLVTNASDAIGGDSGAITVQTDVGECTEEYLKDTVAGSSVQAGTYVALEVSDTGCGMDAPTRQRIFDPFFTTKFAGRGLGLAAVMGIIRGHKGALRVYSEAGKGSSFKLLFPASDVEAVSRGRDEVPVEEFLMEGNIMLVDDDSIVRNVAGKTLERMGFTVVTCNDGQEAVDYFRMHADEVDCILLDLTMPRMGGEEAFHEILQIDPEAKVILSSGYNEQEVVNHVTTRGLAGFIQKPYVRERLAEMFRRILLGDEQVVRPP